MLPPAALVPVVDRLRAAVAAVHRRMAPPPVQIVEGLLGALDYAALGALCSLDVPDKLRGATEVDELAARVGIDAATLGRLVRYAVGRRWLRMDRRGRVHATAMMRFLRRSHPGGWRAWVDFTTGPEVAAAIARVATALAASDGDPFAAANGEPFFEWYSKHADRHAAFDAAMSAGARLHGLALAAAIDWTDVRTVCDVGGGTGAVLRALLDRHEHLHGVLYDLPEVVDRVEASERLEVVSGDAFDHVPGDCDVYLFVNVLHDWNDERCIALLNNVRESGVDGARAIVVEGERRQRPVDGIALRTDLLMLALTPGGRERTTDEFAALASRAGMRLRDWIRLASGDRAHVIQPAPRTTSATASTL
jgi:O-methyltransferase domain